MALYFLRARSQSSVSAIESMEGGVHVTHRDHVVNLPDTEPVKDIRHEGLKTHIFHAGD